MLTDEEMQQMGYTAWRTLPDGSMMAVALMAFNNGRLFMDVNTSGYEDCYCYDSLQLAMDSMNNYNPDIDAEPTGWKRHPFTGRRRTNGDAATEYIAR